MTKKRLIKLLMGRAHLSRNSARLISKWANGWNNGKVSNDMLYSTFEPCTEPCVESKAIRITLLSPNGVNCTIHY